MLVSVAPMMDWTDRHDRYFLRLISKHVLLYTEMVTTGALIHGDYQHFLAYHPAEHPLALQLGGNDPTDLALCAKMAENEGYDEVNLNVGCPSDRVQKGCFGAALMAEPDRVAECVAAMQHAVSIPVTVKTRIGIDAHDSLEFLHHFIRTVYDAGCRVFIIHARKAWLKGLSPKQNREVPPLRYDVVRSVKENFSDCKIILNGGIQTIGAVEEHLKIFDGVMLGRAAYQNPYLLADIEETIFGEEQVVSREEVIHQFIPYVQEQLQRGVYLSKMTRHILGLFLGEPGAKRWRRHLSENARNAQCAETLLRDALVLRCAPSPFSHAP